MTYHAGATSPTAEQIQRISAKLRQYGEIKAYNVIYWFMNRSARERQKKRVGAVDILMHRPPTAAGSDHHIYSKFSNINSGNFASSSASSAAGLLNVGSYGYGSVTMEKRFRECSITPTVNVGGQNFAWIGVDPYSSSPYPFLKRKRYINDQTLETAEEEEPPEIETLPLFPMHGDVKQDFNGWVHGGEVAIAGAGSRASLELSLNAYGTAGFNH